MMYLEEDEVRARMRALKLMTAATIALVCTFIILSVAILVAVTR